MDNVTLTLSALVTVGLIIMMTPKILTLQRGKGLRNLALWVAIFLCLALFYRHFGPGRDARLPAPESAPVIEGEISPDQ